MTEASQNPVVIPEQLRDWRFVLLKPKSKEPFEKDWQNTANYAYNDPKLLEHLNTGGNYGVLLGFYNDADHIVVDADDSEIVKLVGQKLPATFTVRTGSGGIHFYFVTSSRMQTRPLVNPENRENVGHIKAQGSQVAGPYSVHPNGKLYIIEDGKPFASTTEQEIRATLAPFIAERTKAAFVKRKDYTNELDFPILSIAGIQDGSQTHPIHGSKSNLKNLHVDGAKNLWFCYACESGGPSLHLFAVTERIIGCWEASRKGLRGDKFKEAKRRAIEQGLIKKPKPAATSKTSSKKHTEPEILDLATMAQLPDWEPDGRITITLKLEKNRDGEQVTGYYRVFQTEKDSLEGETFAKSRFMPPTMPTQTVLTLNPLQLQQIHEKLRDIVDKHTYQTKPLYYSLIALGAEASYFREVFENFPYFDFLSAENGAGKTTALKCLVWPSFYGILQMNPTSPVLFRQIEDTHGAVGIDQVDELFKNPRQNRDILTLLDSGYSKGIPAYRVNMDASPPEILPYDPFSVKGFTRTGWIPPDLASRAITIKMVEAKGFKVLPSPPKIGDFQEIRDQLYTFRLWHYEQVTQAYRDVSENQNLSGRIRDIYLPLLTMAKLISTELFEKVLEYAKKEDEKRGSIKRDTRLINMVEYLQETGAVGEIPVANIRDGLEPILHKNKLLKADEELSSQQVITWLEGLGFERSAKRTGNYVHYNIVEDVLDRDKTIYLQPETLTPSQKKLTNLSKLTPKGEAELASLAKLGSTETTQTSPDGLGSHVPGDSSNKDPLEQTVKCEYCHEPMSRRDYQRHRCPVGVGLEVQTG